MKKLFFLIGILAISFAGFSQTNPKVEVYYFHLKNRCATCKAVESVTTETLKNHFDPQMKSGELKFTSIDLEDKEFKDLAKTLKVRGQALLLVKGDKKTDLTNQGFQYARTKPKDLENIMVKELKSLLK